MITDCLKSILLACLLGMSALATPVGAAPDSALDQATSYFRQALETQPPERQLLQLRAIQLLLDGSYTFQAKNALSELDTRGLPAPEIQQKQLLLARIALLERAPNSAIIALKAIASPASPEIDRSRHQLLIQAYTLSGDQFNELQSRLALHGSLDNAAAEAAANTARINVLFDRLYTELSQHVKGIHAEREQWQLRYQRLQQQLTEWRQTHPELVTQPTAPSDSAYPGPRRIAVLLPLTGRFASAGQAIRAGIQTAYNAQDHSRPELDFLDTREDPATAVKLYQQAIDRGADFIIGPLTKEAVSAVAQSAVQRLPTLALNYLATPTQVPEAMYQYSLAPEEEAKQVALRAWQDGHRRAIIYSPNNSWGQRLATSYADTWRSLGGKVVANHHYANDKTDYADSIRNTLHLPPAKGKRKREPNVRTDVDVIFLVANPTQARLWRPQLLFHYAGQIPVYSTSHLFTGSFNERTDRDLDGIIFGDMPWVLDLDDTAHPLRSFNTNRDESSLRLVAFGIDAYQLSIYLFRATASSPPFMGESGKLSLQVNRLIDRQLVWAQFRNGIPEPYLTP